jgi:hypothetical protein
MYRVKKKNSARNPANAISCVASEKPRPLKRRDPYHPVELRRSGAGTAASRRSETP